MSADKLTELPNSTAVYRKVYGGAVYIDADYATIEGCSFDGCVCSAKNGGCDVYDNNGTSTVKKCRTTVRGDLGYDAFVGLKELDCFSGWDSRWDGTWHSTGSVLSEGSLTIVVGVAAAVVFGLGGFFIGTKKKKKPALAESDDNTDEE